MSTKLHIAIYSNLPSGGARELRDSNVSYLKKCGIEISQYVGRQVGAYPNFIAYMFNILYILPIQHRNFAKIINGSKATIFISYHSWITKSPILMQYIKKNKVIYICHEPPREYYDQQHRSKQSNQEKIINFLRLPIKYIDFNNINNTKNLLVIANSKFAKKNIDKAYGVNSKVIYPGIPTEKYRPKKRRKFARKQQYVAISVGAINKLKNQEYLVRSIANIDKSNRPSLVLVGNGGDKHYIQHLSKLASYHNVNLSIKLNITESQLIQEFSEADIFLYSPIAEPFGLVVLEAMAAGLPIVATNNGGGYVEVLTQNNAVLSSSVDSKSFANDIIKLLNDSDKCSQMSLDNLRDVENYDSQLMNQKLWKIIQQST